MKILFHLIEIILIIFTVYALFPLIIFPFFYHRIKSLIKEKRIDLKNSSCHFIILVPAANEEKFLPVLLESIKNQDYPAELTEVLVIADNCTDNTADIARQYNYMVLEKNDQLRSGKSMAILSGFRYLKSIRPLNQEIIVLLDSDCVLEKGFLSSLASEIEASPEIHVFQCYREVRDLESSGISAIDAANEALRQWVQLGVRTLLKADVSIHGSGMAFRIDVFERMLNETAFNLTEDKLWNIFLLKNHYRIRWVPSAHLSYYATDNYRSFSHQRFRWISGQYTMAKKYGFSLLFQGLKEANFSLIDFAFSLFIPPRSFLFFLLLLTLMLNLIFQIHPVFLIIILTLLVLLFVLNTFLGFLLSNLKIKLKNIIFTGSGLVGISITNSILILAGKKSEKWGKSR